MNTLAKQSFVMPSDFTIIVISLFKWLVTVPRQVVVAEASETSCIGEDTTFL